MILEQMASWWESMDEWERKELRKSFEAVMSGCVELASSDEDPFDVLIHPVLYGEWATDIWSAYASVRFLDEELPPEINDPSLNDLERAILIQSTAMKVRARAVRERLNSRA